MGAILKLGSFNFMKNWKGLVKAVSEKWSEGGTEGERTTGRRVPRRQERGDSYSWREKERAQEWKGFTVRETNVREEGRWLVWGIAVWPGENIREGEKERDSKTGSRTERVRKRWPFIAFTHSNNIALCHNNTGWWGDLTVGDSEGVAAEERAASLSS